MSRRHDPHAPTATDSLEEAVGGADAVVVATNHDEFADPKTLRLIVERAGGDCPGRRSLERVRRGQSVRDRRRGRLACREGRSRPRPACRSRARRPLMSKVLVTGGAGTIGSAVVRRLAREGGWTIRVSDQRAGTRVDGAAAARSTPPTCATSGPRATRSRAAPTSSTWPRSSAASPTSTSSPTRCSR